MPKPVTPLVGSDVFVVNERAEVLLVQRSDSGFWALPGGCQELGESPAEGAARECFEETGYSVEVTGVLGIYSSTRYEYVNYPWKENEFCHLLFRAEVRGGEARVSSESLRVEWFAETSLPPLSDGHGVRIRDGFRALRDPDFRAHFE